MPAEWHERARLPAPRAGSRRGRRRGSDQSGRGSRDGQGGRRGNEGLDVALEYAAARAVPFSWEISMPSSSAVFRARGVMKIFSVTVDAAD